MTRAKFVFNRNTGFNQIRLGDQDESTVEYDVDKVILNSGSTFDLNGATIPYTPEDPSQWSEIPTNLVQAVDYLAAGSGSGGGGGGGGGTPGGSNGDIQYRVNGTTFGGVSKIRFVGGDVFVTGSFLGDVNGTASYATNATNALTASFVQQAVSSSFATSALTASYVLNAVSSSFATNALTASYVLQAVSASYANNALSASYSTNALSASFASTALTASFVQNAVSASYATNALSASYAGYAETSATSSVALSSIQWEDGGNKLATTSSLALAGGLGTGYFADNVDPTINLFVSGTAVIGGNLIVSGVLETDTITGNILAGSKITTDYIELTPVTAEPVPGPNGTYLYSSGSTNDLFIVHNNGSLNKTNFRWVENSLGTGLLQGGILSTEAGTTTFSVTAGEGVILSYNATTSSIPDAVIKQVSWNAFTSQSLTYSGSDTQTFIGISDTGALFQQVTPFTPEQYALYIPLGRILHVSGSITYGIANQPRVSYGQTTWNGDFVRAFGPLKLSGHVLQASGSTLSITKTGGAAYIEGKNYLVDPNSPNVVNPSSDGPVTVSKIFREYVSGSNSNNVVIDTNGGAGFTGIDPNNYNNSGTLTPVTAGKFTTQRVYWAPNSSTNAFWVYYGSSEYNSLSEAQADLPSEIFTEGNNTIGATILVANILVVSGATDLSNTTQARFIQGGLFRGSGIGVGGAGGVTVPGGINTYVQFNDGGSTFGGDAGLTYNKTTNTLSVDNVTATTFTGSFLGNLVGTASYATNAGNALTASFVQNAVSSSYASSALTASYATNALSASYASNADLLDNLNSTDFARLAVSNAFTANQVVTGSVTSTTGFTGSLTKLTDGSDYLVAGTNITLTTGSNGAITIDAGAAGIVSGSSKNVIYVAKNGSNSSISGSISSPFLTIQGAINYIESKRPSVYSNTEDVVILVAPGIYSEDITFTKPFINVMGYVPTQYSKATQLSGLVNINNTSNPGGGTGQTFGIYNFLITAPTTASANVISFSGTGNGSLILENMQAVGGGSNQSILYVSKSAAVATNCRVKVRHSIFNTETSGSSGPTTNIFNVYSIFESCEIVYSGSVSGGTVLNTNNATVDFLRGTLSAATSNSVVAKITGSSLTPLTVGDTAVLGTSTGTNGFLIAPGATFVSGKNAFSIATGTTFVVSGSATSNFVTAFDGIFAGGILYNNRISNTMTTTFGSASYTKVT